MRQESPVRFLHMPSASHLSTANDTCPEHAIYLSSDPVVCMGLRGRALGGARFCLNKGHRHFVADGRSTLG